jgi:pyruvate/2-oxoglutarate dehydrogenase complex dihydrolipoamide dehydrogenase (E3) component
MSERFDAVVVGMGPAGEVAASRLLGQGLRVAVVERELIGGECAYWACIPSKTLLRPPEVRAEARRAAGVGEAEQRWQELVEYRDYMIRHLDDGKEVEGYERDGASVVKGEARIAGPGRVEVDGRTLQTERIVIATGSDPNIPPIKGLEEVGYWTNREATTLSELPASVVILGGGPVGVELGQFFCRSGVAVTLVQSADRLIHREDAEVSSRILDALREEGVDVRLSAEATEVRREDGRRVITLQDGSEVAGQELILAAGRSPRVHGIGLESIGVQPTARGVAVDERCRVTDRVWAIGDVTGVMPFTHVGMYQGRIVAADIAGKDVRADYAAIPRVVFSDPEIAAVGLTAEQANQREIDVTTSQIALADSIARPWTYERDPRGELGLIADRRRGVLVGAWALAPMAGEWIHYAALAIKAQIPIEVLADTVAQFPTYTEGYLKAIEKLELD